MEVIDLLNKIANGEEVPNKIRVGNSAFELSLVELNGKIHYSGNTDSVLNDVLGMAKLNDYVEIIEDTPKEETTINIQDLFNERVEQNKRIEELVNINEKLSLALESAEQRIDKSIEYIETKISDKKGVVVLPDLLDILRGEDGDE